MCEKRAHLDRLKSSRPLIKALCVIKENAVPGKNDVTEVNEMEIEGLGILRTGDKVKHPVFGKGIVEEGYVWESGERTIRVLFKKNGSKALVPEYANLKRRLW